MILDITENKIDIDAESQTSNVCGNMIADKRKRYYIYPSRMVWKSSDNVSNFSAVMKESSERLHVCTGESSESFVLDFGAELHGSLLLSVDLIKQNNAFLYKAKFRLRFGESVSEVMGVPNNDHSIHDIHMDLPAMSHNEFGQTGFRFVRIDILSENVDVSFREIKAVALEFPWKYMGTFSCNEPLLNRIYTTCARTTLLCCQEFLWDGIKRDRLAWAGDVHPQLATLSAVFGMQASEIVEKTLAFMADSVGNNEWINGISSYSLWWLISVYEWYIYTGDIDFLKRQITRIEKIASKVLRHVSDDGCENLDGMRFLDWSSAGEANIEKIRPGLQALMIWGLKCTSSMAGKVENRVLRDRCDLMLKKLGMWKFPPIELNQNAMLGVFAGIYDADRIHREFFESLQNTDMSPWFGGYYLDIKAISGDVSGGLDLIRDYWGGMLNLGATTFWEHFDMRWIENASRIDEIPVAGKVDVHASCGNFCYKGLRHSLCHGWSSRPAAWLAQNVLGIKSLAPGMQKVQISPQLGNLEYAYGTYPTPSGLIKVLHKRLSDNTISSTIEVPDGVEIVQAKKEAI